MKFEVLSANAMGKHHTCKMFICFDLLPSFMMQEVSVEHHHLLRPGSEPMPLKPFSIDPVKGWTRASCVAFIALAVSELDLSDAGNLEKIKPITKVLDRSWMLPMHVSWCFHLQPCFLQAFLTCRNQTDKKLQLLTFSVGIAQQ